ncbi:glycosyltransferase family 4 protein [Candidatus Pseudothioglobus singularis]|nr:glycosyltransferase family 4 protein [Candidatus Pseudothioglobus singularis]
MLKILYITNTSYTLLSLRMNLMQSMLNDGYEVFAAAPKDSYSEKLARKGINFHHLPMTQTGVNFFQELRTILNIIFILFKSKPNLLHLFSIKSILWGGLASVFFKSMKVVLTFTGMGILKSTKNNLLKKSLFFIIKISHNERKEYVFQNHSDLVYFEENTGINASLNLIQGSGVDLNYYFRFNGTAQSKKKITFLMFSRMLYSKGVFDYLEAVKNVNEDFGNQAEFILLGGVYPSSPSEVDKEWITGIDYIDPSFLLFKANEAKVSWIEHDSNVLDYLCISDVVVLPSYYPEGLPRSLLEAMSCENVIITSNNPGCKEVCDGTNGFVVNKNDVEQLEKSIKKCITMKNTELNKMKKRSRDIVKDRFSDKIVIDAYKNIYKKL